MLLLLDGDDLKEEYRGIPCDATHFSHFKPEVQAAIRAAGEALYQVCGENPCSYCENYNRIFLPPPPSS